jgi:hypothetical protein
MPSDRSRKNSRRLQLRDYELLRSLFECRMMTLAQAAALHFEGKYEAASKRVQALKAARYIGDRRKQVGAPSLLYLPIRLFSFDGRTQNH